MACTYTSLQSSILDYAKDTSLTTANAQTFIADAEPKLERDMMSPEYGSGIPAQMLANSQGNADANGKYSLPADVMAIRSVRVSGHRARQVSSEMLVSGSSSGYGNADVTVKYYQRIPPLSGTVSSNWLLDVGCDCYRWGALLQYAAWGLKSETVQVWQTYYADAVRTVRNAYRMGARGNVYRQPNKYYGAFYTIEGGDIIFGGLRT